MITTTNSLLTRGVVDLLVKEDLEKKLKSGKKLRIKFGIDPTKPDMHLGHSVPLRKLREFQQVGHHIILLFGGFTATIGDPTGKNDARPPLTMKEVDANASDYLKYAGKILDTNNIEIVNNKNWFQKMNPEHFITLMAQFSVAQMLERDMFTERQKNKQAIYCHEILYPMLQGYDSVELRADVEIGGTDQLFNLLVGRELQKKKGQIPQNIITVPILEGLDGKEKMSKSLNNYISMNEEYCEMFGKIMSIPDNIMLKYFELLTDENLEKMNELIQNDPKNAKVYLAKKIISFYYTIKEAELAEEDFNNKFVKKNIPDNFPEFIVEEEKIGILNLISQVTKFTTSNAEARRLVKSLAVSIDQNKIIDPNEIIKISSKGVLLQVGKRKYGKIKYK